MSTAGSDALYTGESVALECLCQLHCVYEAVMEDNPPGMRVSQLQECTGCISYTLKVAHSKAKAVIQYLVDDEGFLHLPSA